MDKKIKTLRFIQSKWVPLILTDIFTITFYISYFTLLDPKFSSPNPWIMDFIKRFSTYIPLALAGIILLTSYLLILVKWILRLNFWWIHFLLFLMVYGVFFAIWIQLKYYEPRYTDIAVFIITLYSLPLIISSVITLIFTIVFTFIKKKKSL